MRPILWALAAVVVGLAIFEIAMQPSGAERAELGVIFGLMAVAMATIAGWLPQLARRYRSIRSTVTVLSLAAFSIVFAGVVAIGNLMFVSPHDLTLLLVVIAFGVVAAIGFAISISRPLTKDLAHLSDSASRVASGHLNQHLALDRRDEVGRLSIALDRMTGQLEATARAREADLSARTEFFAAVGHDLRTPLASMQAAIEAVQDGVSEDPRAQLESVEQDIAALTRLVDDIYLLARLDSGATVPAMEPVDIIEAADETLEILRPLAESRGVELVLAADARFFLEGSQASLGRILRNLGDNAIRHSPSGTRIEVGITQQDHHVVVTVSDEGPGFDPGFEAIAFDRFSRFEPWRSRDSGGSGLGLAIARSLVESMGGQIWIGPGPGGRVSFGLPLAENAGLGGATT
jgi:two-component system sensor histidine kinase BaeS